MRIELDSADETITVDDVKISLELLRNLANPDPDCTYRMRRIGNVTTLTVMSDSEMRFQNA